MHGNICARTDCESDIGLRQSWRIVDAVADHGDDFAIRLMLLQNLELILGQHLGMDSLDTELRGDIFGDDAAVTGHHRAADSGFGEFGDRIRRFLANRIGEGNSALHLSVGKHKQHRRALVVPLLNPARQIGRYLGSGFGENAIATNLPVLSVDTGRDAATGMALEIGDIGEL